MTATSSVAHTDPDILGGTPVFAGTRVPIHTLLDYLAFGACACIARLDKAWGRRRDHHLTNAQTTP
jgi:hypothetical protein